MKHENASRNSGPHGPWAIPPRQGQSQLISPVSGLYAPPDVGFESPLRSSCCSSDVSDTLVPCSGTACSDDGLESGRDGVSGVVEEPEDDVIVMEGLDDDVVGFFSRAK